MGIPGGVHEDRRDEASSRKGASEAEPEEPRSIGRSLADYGSKSSAAVAAVTARRVHRSRVTTS